MSKIRLPAAPKLEAPRGLEFPAPDQALARWNPGVRAATEKDDDTISMYDVIGDFYGEGVSAKRVAAALRKIGDREVTVNINSPGGDLFEGIAIYNLLRDHPQQVTVKVMGMAASAASIIAMAGDRILMGEGAFQMIHNAWVLAIGDRNDLMAASERLGTFDDALASLYAARTGVEKSAVAGLMDDETWFSADQAIETGMADGKLADAEVADDGEEQNSGAPALRRIEAALARQGMSRNERRSLIGDLLDGQPAVAAAQRPAVADVPREEIRDYLLN